MQIAALKRSALVLLAFALALSPVQSSAREGTRSPGKAALLSLLVPGVGEFYAGGPRSGRFFLFTEGLFWTGMAVFKSLESSRTDTYRAYAAAHAGVRLDGKPERALMVGDHPMDILAGQQAGMRTAAITFTHPTSDFADAQPDFVIESIPEMWDHIVVTKLPENGRAR